MNTSSSFMGRRRFLGLAAGASVAGTLSPSILAGSHASHPASTPPTGVFSTKVGDVRITALLDGVIPLQKGYFSGEEQAINAVLEAIGRADGNLPAPINAYLIQTGGKNILVDAGMGAIDGFGPGYGQISAALQAAGVTPEQIDTLVITHAHPDHLGGVLSATGTAVFPKATLIISETEFAFWNSVENLTTAPDEAKGIFEFAQIAFSVYADRVRQVPAGTEVAPGMTLEAAPGHTPGHSILRINTGAQEILMVADLFHSAELHTALPDLGFGFDIDPAQAAATRKKLFDQVATDKTLILGSHAHFPGFGRILRDGEAYRYIPVSI